MNRPLPDRAITGDKMWMRAEAENRELCDRYRAFFGAREIDFLEMDAEEYIAGEPWRAPGQRQKKGERGKR